MPRSTIGLIITGVDEIDKRLKTLPAKVRNKIVRAAMRRGMYIVHAKAQANAPVRTGKLQKAIVVRAGLKPKKGEIVIDCRVGAGDFKGDTFYGGFQEFGWRAGPRRLGNSRRLIEGRHFMENAFISEGEKARQVTMDDLLAGALAESAES